MRRLLPCIALLLAACGSPSPDAPLARAGEACGEGISCAEGLTCAVTSGEAGAPGTCVRGAAPERSLAAFAGRIDERMTEADVRAAFGPPDRDIGSGIHIFVYELTDGSQVWIGLADRALYARNVDAEGNLIEVLTDGQTLPDMTTEPVSFQVPAGMEITKRVQALPGGPVTDASICGGARAVDLGEGDMTLYVIHDREGSAAYAVSVVPNGPGFADAAEAASAFGCEDSPLIAINEDWLAFGLRSGPGEAAASAEQSVLATIRPR